jgi:quinohemoprotein ethanol dehydrogenase
VRPPFGLSFGLTTLLAAWTLCGGVTGAQPASDRPIAPSPAFNASQLVAAPTANWITNGGSLNNQRYSAITSLNRQNVAGLKAVWRASLGGSGVGPRYAGQAQPIVYDGVVYVVTGADDVFAIDVDSGKILWSYKAEVDHNKARPCCSWTSRGVAIGDGKIFLGTLDARLIALDQATGKVVWRIQAEDPKLGYAITSAPLYYNGMVITGFAGGDLGTRGRVKAYDAADGKLRWTFYTVPGPGQVGHETWPQDNAVWTHGGAPVWQTPAIDPQMGLIYFSTGNPGPDLNGARRAGDNLFSASIVALDVATGKYRWHFQEVHHDLWDYDAPNPVVLFDAVVDGKPRKALAQAGKTGWVYILDRITGKPLIGIVETPVAQEPVQHTSPTQPFPVGDAIVPQSIDVPLEGYKLVNQGRIFTPFTREPVLYKPQAAINWPPSSYDPAAHLIFICANDAMGSAKGGDPDYPVEPGEFYSGSVFGRFSAPRRGIFAALDVTTNRIAWRQQWFDTCYSGSVTALNTANGDKLWEFQTDGGVNAPATVFERHGKPYVVVLAAGANLGFSKRSDGVWLFALDGTIASLPKGSADAAGQFAAHPVAAAKARAPSLANGEKIFSQTCASCHGQTGQGGHMGGPALTKALTQEMIVNTVANGRNQMPAFGAVLTAEDLQDVAAYIRQKLAVR